MKNIIISSNGLIFYVQNVNDDMLNFVFKSMKYFYDATIPNVSEKILQDYIKYKNSANNNSLTVNPNDVMEKSLQIFVNGLPDDVKNDPVIFQKVKDRYLDKYHKLNDFFEKIKKIDVRCSFCGVSLYGFLNQFENGCSCCWAEFLDYIIEFLSEIDTKNTFGLDDFEETNQSESDNSNAPAIIMTEGQSLPSVNSASMVDLLKALGIDVNKLKNKQLQDLINKEKEIEAYVENFITNYDNDKEFLKKELEYFEEQLKEALNNNSFDMVKIFKKRIEYINQKITEKENPNGETQEQFGAGI